MSAAAAAYVSGAATVMFAAGLLCGMSLGGRLSRRWESRR